MEIDLTKKYNYKLRNLKTGKFYSNGKKSTWARPSAVIQALTGKTGWRSLKAKEWEVVLIPLEDPLVISSDEFINFYKEKDDEKKRKKEEAEQRRREAVKKQKEREEIALLKMLKKKYPDN
jgi:hypothetical protein